MFVDLAIGISVVDFMGRGFHLRCFNRNEGKKDDEAQDNDSYVGVAVSNGRDARAERPTDHGGIPG